MACELYITYSSNAGAISNRGISKNPSSLTTAITSIAASGRLAIGTKSATNLSVPVSWAGILVNNDAIRPHTDGSGDGSNPDRGSIHILAREII